MNKKLTIILNGLLMFGLNGASYAQNEPVLKLEKTKMLADYQVQLVCDSTAIGDPQNCHITVYNPNEQDKSKATLIVPNSEVLINIDNKERKQNSPFSSANLDLAEKPSGIYRQKYRISRDWLLRIELSEDDKKPDISIFSPIIPKEK